MPPKGKVVDHVNHNKLDNRKSNLNVVLHKENMQNRKGAQVNSTTKIRGVSYNKKRNKYEAYFTLNRKRRFVGFFNNKEDAEKAVSKARTEAVSYLREIQGDKR